MEIIIEGKNASEYFNQSANLQWKAARKRQLFGVKIFFLIGVILSTHGVLKGYDSLYTTSQSSNNSTTNEVIIQEYTTKNNYHITFGLGIALILLSIYFVYLAYYQKNKFLQSIAKKQERLKKDSNEFYIKINTEGVYYKDFELTREQKWSTFSHYRVFNDSLLLFQDEFYSSAIVISNNLVTEKDFENLVIFIKNKLPEKN